MRFVDTSFWIALRNRRDPFHDEARQLYDDSVGRGLVTTNDVRGESWTWLRRKIGHRSAVDFLDATERSPRVKVFPLSEKLEADALAWLRRHDERPYSFVDATSFAVMRSLKLREALSFDGDFAAAGFVQVRA